MGLVVAKPPAPPTPDFKCTHAQVRVVSGVAHLMWLDVLHPDEVRCFDGSRWTWCPLGEAKNYEFVREVPNKSIIMEVPYA